VWELFYRSLPRIPYGVTGIQPLRDWLAVQDALPELNNESQPPNQSTIPNPQGIRNRFNTEIT